MRKVLGEPKEGVLFAAADEELVVLESSVREILVSIQWRKDQKSVRSW